MSIVASLIKNIAGELVTKDRIGLPPTGGGGGAGLVIEGATSDAEQSGQDTYTLPADIESGELILVICSNDDPNNPDSLSITGYTKILEVGTSAVDVHLAAFYKIADGTETEVTITNGRADTAVFMFRISGQAATPINAQAEGLTTGALTISGVTTTVDNCLVFTAFAGDGGDTTPIAFTGTGWSKTGADLTTRGVVAGGCSLAYGTQVQATAGTVPDSTGTPALSDGMTGLQIAIAPA